MKMQKEELARKINKIKSVVPKKGTMPILQGILVKDGYFIANNMEMTVKAKIKGVDGEEFLIPERAFDLINNLPDGEVEIVVESIDKITIKADHIKNTYQTMNPCTFPITKVEDVEEKEITISSTMLLESMKRVFYAIPAQAANPIMASLCLRATGNFLNFVGLDGHVLAWDKVEYEGEFEFLIPKSTVEKLLSIGLTGNVSIKHNGSHVVFVTEDYELCARRVDGKYYEYEKMFGDLLMHTAVVKDELLEAMIRAKMCTEEKCPVKFKISDNTINIFMKDSTTDYNEIIYLKKKLEQELVIGFNAKLVIETLKAFDCKNVGIQLAGPKHPMIVESEDSHFRAIVLPVAIHS